jgi:ParB-like chromosome segregation protein Spo0J
MTSTRRALTIDDPLAAAGACHVARSTAGSTAGRLRDIPLEQIRPNPKQPRRRFDEESLVTLAVSVSRADLARRLGRSRSEVAHTVRVRELPDEAIELIDNGRRTKGHGKALLSEPDHDRRRPARSPRRRQRLVGPQPRSRDQPRRRVPRGASRTALRPPRSRRNPGRHDQQSAERRRTGARSPAWLPAASRPAALLLRRRAVARGASNGRPGACGRSIGRRPRSA